MIGPIEKDTARSNADAGGSHIFELSQKKSLSDYLTAYGTAAAALGAAAAAAMSYMQVRATQEQIAIARDTEEIQLRSYINTELVGVKSKDSEDIFEVDFNVINRGLTPAAQVSVVASVRLKSDPEFKSDVGFKRRSMTKALFLGSNQTYPMYFGLSLKPDNHEATAKEAARFLNEHGAIIFSGEITYKDVFNKDQLSTFCFEGQQETHYITIAPC